MTQYVQLLSKLQHREAEFDELQLDRAELRRLRREAEARLSSTTQQYEEVKTQLDSAESSKQELHERCHSAEEALRFAKFVFFAVVACVASRGLSLNVLCYLLWMD